MRLLGGPVGRRFHQLDPVPKRVIDIRPVITRQRLIVGNVVTALLQADDQLPEAIHDEGGMGLARRHEILLYAQVNLQWTSFKPTPAARGKVGGLGYFGNTKDPLVERPGFILAPDWHGELDMI